MNNRLFSLVAWCSCVAGAALATAQPAEVEPPLTPAESTLIRQAEEARVRAIDSVYGAVVAIYGNDRGGGGSGVLYDEAGFALTNHHVVAAAGVEGWAGLADGQLYRWKIVGTDPGGDVAIIQLLGKDKFPLAHLGNSDSVRVGDFAMAMGNPFVLAEDQRPTVTLGIVSGIQRFQEGSGNNQLVYGNCIQIDSSINPGNSGGPLFNMQGEVIGINGRGSFKERGRVNVGLGYAISINQIKHSFPTCSPPKWSNTARSTPSLAIAPPAASSATRSTSIRRLPSWDCNSATASSRSKGTQSKQPTSSTT
jgi:S1-C subfamily serine protease